MKHFLLNYFNFKINKINSRDLPGGLVSMAPRSPMQWDRVRSLISGDFWGSQEGCQGPFRPSGMIPSFSVTAIYTAGLPSVTRKCPSP